MLLMDVAHLILNTNFHSLHQDMASLKVLHIEATTIYRDTPNSAARKSITSTKKKMSAIPLMLLNHLLVLAVAR
jgi:hypothetical protein